jgi:hypothetical protein
MTQSAEALGDFAIQLIIGFCSDTSTAATKHWLSNRGNSPTFSNAQTNTQT